MPSHLTLIIVSDICNIPPEGGASVAGASVVGKGGAAEKEKQLS